MAGAGGATVGQHAYATVAREVIERVAATQAPAVRDAAQLVAASLRAGGVLQAFATGHSRAIAFELAGRAGGLVPANLLSLRDLVSYGGAPPQTVLDPRAERDPALARRVLELATVEPADAFVIASHSGGNGAVVEMALLVKERGHPLIALTSMAHTTRIASRHPSGKRLFELADVVLDNCAPFGDAALQLPGGGAACGLSTLTGVLLAQMLVAEVVGLLLAAGEEPPLYRSSNVPGGDEHNEALLARYGARVRRGDA